MNARARPRRQALEVLGIALFVAASTATEGLAHEIALRRWSPVSLITDHWYRHEVIAGFAPMKAGLFAVAYALLRRRTDGAWTMASAAGLGVLFGSLSFPTLRLLFSPTIPNPVATLALIFAAQCVLTLATGELLHRSTRSLT